MSHNSCLSCHGQKLLVCPDCELSGSALRARVAYLEKALRGIRSTAHDHDDNGIAYLVDEALELRPSVSTLAKMAADVDAAGPLPTGLLAAGACSSEPVACAACGGPLRGPQYDYGNIGDPDPNARLCSKVCVLKRRQQVKDGAGNLNSDAGKERQPTQRTKEAEPQCGGRCFAEGDGNAAFAPRSDCPKHGHPRTNEAPPKHTCPNRDRREAYWGSEKIPHWPTCEACQAEQRTDSASPPVPFASAFQEASPSAAVAWLENVTRTSVGVTSEQHNAAQQLLVAVRDPSWKGPRPEPPKVDRDALVKKLSAVETMRQEYERDVDFWKTRALRAERQLDEKESQ